MAMVGVRGRRLLIAAATNIDSRRPQGRASHIDSPTTYRYIQYLGSANDIYAVGVGGMQGTAGRTSAACSL